MDDRIVRFSKGSFPWAVAFPNCVEIWYPYYPTQFRSPLGRYVEAHGPESVRILLVTSGHYTTETARDCMDCYYEAMKFMERTKR